MNHVEVAVGYAAGTFRARGLPDTRWSRLRRGQRRGSHVVMQKIDAGSTVTVPVPDYKELRAGTLMSIIRQSGLPHSDFE